VSRVLRSIRPLIRPLGGLSACEEFVNNKGGILG